LKSEHQRKTQFLPQRILYDESAGRQELEEEIAQIQRNVRCVQRAAALMAVLTALVAAGLGYPAILLENFPYSAPRFIVHLICALGVGSLISLLAFVGLAMVYRKMLNKRREECRQMVTRLLESRPGNPVATPWRESFVREGSRGPLQAAAGGNGSPAGFESAAQG
jgi:hypothetical protein